LDLELRNVFFLRAWEENDSEDEHINVWSGNAVEHSYQEYGDSWLQLDSREFSGSAANL
jgi:hypothetical protein